VIPAQVLNERPPFLKGLTVMEVVALTLINTVLGIVIGIVISVTVTTSMMPILIGFSLGAASVFILPQGIANLLIKQRQGKPTGWLYQRIDCAFYTQKYTHRAGRYHNKKDKS
jgi:conjugative transfer region protein (TIGR03750 family)